MPLSTTAPYLGMQLSSPIVVGSCPMTLKPETVRELSLAGAGAIVLPSLFEEQVVHQQNLQGAQPSHEESLVEWMCYDEAENTYNGGLDSYLDTISSLKKTSGIPIIASLNGCTGGGWLNIGRDMQRAGADALEVMLEPDMADPSVSADRVEEKLFACVSALCDQVSIPVAVKISPFHTSLPNLVWRLAEAGASGLVCFAHEPLWDVHADRLETSRKWSLTHAGNINPTIAGLMRVRMAGPSISIAASGGISSPEDLCKILIAGADIGMVTSEVYRAGPDAIAHLLDGLCIFLERHHFCSFAEFSRARPAPDPRLRRSRIKSLTQQPTYPDPTPKLPDQSGDRWGHQP